jgi:hypothetical protein
MLLRRLEAVVLWGRLSATLIFNLWQSSRNRLVDRGRPNTAFEREDDDDMGDDEVKKALQQEKQERDQEIFGQEGDMDEMEYEEEMADDDEKVHADGKEDEEKEYEVSFQPLHRVIISNFFPRNDSNVNGVKQIRQMSK